MFMIPSRSMSATVQIKSAAAVAAPGVKRDAFVDFLKKNYRILMILVPIGIAASGVCITCYTN